jgi:hypothetical protein
MELEALIDEIAVAQRAKVFTCGRSVVPSLTLDDLYQPNDFFELETHPYFRYEEGVLAGILTIRMALSALRKEKAVMEG